MTDKRKLTFNLAWLYAGEAVAKLLATVAFVSLWRRLGPAWLGDLEFAIAVWFVLNLMQEAGLGEFGAREASKRPEETGRLTAAIVTLRFVLVGAGCCVLAVLAAWLPHEPFLRPPYVSFLVLLYALVLVPAPLQLNWVFQARGEMAVVAVSSIIRQVTFAGGVLFLVDSPADLWLVPLCDATGLCVVVLLQQSLFRMRVGRLDFTGVFRTCRGIVRDALPLAVSALVWALRMFGPLMALYAFRGSHETGIFVTGHRLVVAAHMFVFLYFFNLLPAFSRAALEPDRGTFRSLGGASLRLVAWTILPGCLLITALAPWLVPALGKDAYAGSVFPFQIQIWMLAASFISGHMRFALIAFDRQKDELLASVAGAGTMAIGCLALRGDLTPVSAAVIFVAAEFATLVVANLRIRVQVESMGLIRRMWRPLLVTAVVGAATLHFLADQPFVAAGATLVGSLVGLLVFERTIVREAAKLLRSVRG